MRRKKGRRRHSGRSSILNNLRQGLHESPDGIEDFESLGLIVCSLWVHHFVAPSDTNAVQPRIGHLPFSLAVILWGCSPRSSRECTYLGMDMKHDLIPSFCLNIYGNMKFAP